MCGYFVFVSMLDCHFLVISDKDSSICSIHGLIRGEDMELGRDSDTGGQVCTAIGKRLLS